MLMTWTEIYCMAACMCTSREGWSQCKAYTLLQHRPWLHTLLGAQPIPCPACRQWGSFTIRQALLRGQSKAGRKAAAKRGCAHTGG